MHAIQTFDCFDDMVIVVRLKRWIDRSYSFFKPLAAGSGREAVRSWSVKSRLTFRYLRSEYIIPKGLQLLHLLIFFVSANMIQWWSLFRLRFRFRMPHGMPGRLDLARQVFKQFTRPCGTLISNLFLASPLSCRISCRRKVSRWSLAHDRLSIV